MYLFFWSLGNWCIAFSKICKTNTHFVRMFVFDCLSQFETCLHTKSLNQNLHRSSIAKKGQVINVVKGTPVSSNNKTEILLKVTLNTNTIWPYILIAWQWRNDHRSDASHWQTLSHKIVDLWKCINWYESVVLQTKASDSSVLVVTPRTIIG
jgi:hypothetical protein